MERVERAGERLRNYLGEVVTQGKRSKCLDIAVAVVFALAVSCGINIALDWFIPFGPAWFIPVLPIRWTMWRWMD